MKTRSKLKRKLETHQENYPLSSAEFSLSITKVAVAQICKSVGFKRAELSALDTLTLLATKYLRALAESAASFSNAANRTQSNLFDLINAIHDLAAVHGGFDGASTLHADSCLLGSGALKGNFSFVSSTDEIPFAKPIGKVVQERERGTGNHCMRDLRRGGHVPEWLPEFPEVGGWEECRGKDGGRVGEVLWENLSLVGKNNRDLTGKRNGGDLGKERERVRFRIVGKRLCLKSRCYGETKEEQERETEEKRMIVRHPRKALGLRGEEDDN